MNKYLKIILPCVVLIAIISIIIVTTSDKEATNEALKEVAPFNFVEYIEGKIDSEITDGEFEKYQMLYKEIETEEGLVDVIENEKVLSRSDADECYSYLFNAYFEEFKNKADKCFSSSNWTNCNKIRNEAEKLKKRRGSQSQTQALNKYITYVSTYNSICSKMMSCSSKTNYDEIRRSPAVAEAPYTNNTRLKNALQTAKSSWESYLQSEYQTFLYYSPSYGYGEFYQKKEDLQGKIQEFGLNFSPNNDYIQGLTSTLIEVYHNLTNTQYNNSSQY